MDLRDMRGSLRVFAALVIVGFASMTFAESALGDAAPWRARRRPGTRASERASVLVDVSEWSAEPASPDAATIDVARFTSALRELCGSMPRDRPQRYAEWIVGASREAGLLLGREPADERRERGRARRRHVHEAWLAQREARSGQ